MGVTFTASIIEAPGMKATGIPVPDAAVAALDGGKSPAVSVALPGYTFRGRIGSLGGVSMISLSAAHRAASGLKAGDSVEVTLDLDNTPRTVDVSDDLAEALAAGGVRERFDSLPYSRKRGLVEPMEAVKSAETRARRIKKIVTDLQSS